MIKSLRIANFRSIQKTQEVELAPITLVYGGNGTGKSSLLYSLLVLKNIVLNPNQSHDAFFNLAVANLGGFQQVIYDHRPHETMVLGISLDEAQTQLKYQVSMAMNKGEFTLEADSVVNLEMRLNVTFPYPANSQVKVAYIMEEHPYDVTWNGLTATVVVPPTASQLTQEQAKGLNILLNRPTEALRRVDFIPLRRGFSKPQYQATPPTPALVGEDEVASLIAQDPYLPGKLSIYLQEITNREFRLHVPLGTALFYPQTVERISGLTTELVNDGFGTNQLVYFLAKALRSETQLACVEEPEINLHPTSIRQLAQGIVRMVEEEKKQFLISTHSEPLVLALLSQVAKRKLKPKDLACYLATKTRKITRYERQGVNDKGQIEGGLKSFMEAELEDLKLFLGA